MILKTKDALDDQVRQIEQALSGLGPGRERERLKKDLAIMRAGAKGEQEAAYHIDFHLKDSPNWAVIHDLRIEWNGRVAQIDHLLIDRFLEIYVIESKSFRTKIRFANGGWERLNFNHWEGISSPVDQNERHILVLRDLIDQIQLAPTRMGMALTPSYFNFVVVHPACSIVGTFPKDVRIHRMDDLVAAIRKDTPTALGLLKVIAPDTLMAFASRLAAWHQPPPKTTPVVSEADLAQNCSLLDRPVARLCQGCGGAVTNAEADYCLARKARFAGQVLCRKCQNLAPVQVPATAANIKRADSGVAPPSCAQCGSAVDSKVVAFCRFNAKRFTRRILCRACQIQVPQCQV